MEERILILAPRGRDAQIASDLLTKNGLEAQICGNVKDLAAELAGGAGAALITEEALGGDRAPLSSWVAMQPTWSDLPFIVLANGGSAPRTARAAEALEDLGNVLLLQRPLHAEAMLGAARSALKARRRQYEVRAASITLERAVMERTSDLAAARDSLEFALSAASMGSWDLDLETGNLERSKLHDQIFGHRDTLPEWNVRLFLEHVEPTQRKEVAAAFDAAPGTGKLDIECRITGADGVSRWIVKKGRVRYCPQGRPLRITGVVSDITERKEADAQLAQAQKMDAIGQLTGGVAHDFNNLLTPIVGSLDLVRRRHKDDARTQKYISGAMRAAERAATLTHRLLSFARRQALQPQAVNITGLIEGIAELIQRSLGPTIQIKLDFPKKLPPARVDPNQLELALLNLAINARDAMPAGGRLTLSVACIAVEEKNAHGLKGGDYIRITASDTGTGMDHQTLARATEPFFSTKELGKGTGLGLSMVHGLAAQSGGALQLFSRPGEGTCVALWLPATEAAAQIEATPRAEPVTASHAARVLLVDDEEIVRHATAEMLRDIGYLVEEAGSAAQALAALQAGERMEVVVTDYLMPGMTGAGLIAELRANGVGIPVLLITGYAPAGSDVPPDVLRLSKPFRQVDLAAKVDELLRISAAGSA
jgi:signal transduction histidine kinase/CheY-like chemotaxis protein